MAGNYGDKTSYKPEYCEDIINFFTVTPYRLEQSVSPKGIPITIKIPCNLPTLAGWAAEKRISTRAIFTWANQFTEFGDAIEVCKALQESILLTNGLQGLYNNSVTIFAMKNLCGWTDKVETKVEANITMDSLFQRVMGTNAGHDFIEQKNNGLENAEVLNIQNRETYLMNEVNSMADRSIRQLVKETV